MTTLNKAMDAPVRQVKAKVEITYSNPFSTEIVDTTATETGRDTYPEELVDNVEVPAYKWFPLHDNKLDGSHHPFPVNRELSVGWWGTQLSNGSGVFSSPPVITVTFTPRTISNIRLFGDSLLNTFPVDFVFNLYNSSDVLLHSEVVNGNTDPHWAKAFEVFIPFAAKIVVTISKINKPNSVAKLTELFTAIVEVYEGEILEQVKLLEEIGYNTGSLPLGNVSSNELTVTLSNFDRRFDVNNSQSKLYTYVRRNRRVKAWLGADIDGSMEWESLGSFWTTQWDVPEDSLSAVLTARDRLEVLRLSPMAGYPVLENYSLYDLFQLIFVDGGLEDSEYDLDPALDDIVIPYVWFGKVSHRQAIAHLAGCAPIQVYCTRDNRVRVNLGMDGNNTHALLFEENTTPYVYMPFFPHIIIGGTYTVSCDVYWDGPPANVGHIYSTIFMNTPGSSNRHVININRDGTLAFMSYSGAYNGLAVHNFPEKRWVNLVCVSDAGVKTIYMDGEPVGVPGVTYAPSYGGAATISATQIGTNGYGPMNGKIDNFAVWSTARSQEQVRQHMNHDIPVPSEGLSTYYKFNENGVNPVTANFVGKVSGSTVANPHSGYRSSASTLLAPNAGGTIEFSDFHYERISVLDGNVFAQAHVTTNGIDQVRFSFDLIQLAIRERGVPLNTMTTAEAVTWLKANVRQLVANWYGFGSGPSGNRASLKVWLSSGAWSTTTQTHTAATISELKFTTTAEHLDNGGFMHFLAYAEASNGTVASTINTDYVELYVEFKNTAIDSSGNGNNGTIIGASYTTDVPPVTIMDGDINIYKTKFPLAVTDQINTVFVTAQSWSPVTGQQVYNSDVISTAKAGQYTTHTYEFSQTPVVSVELVSHSAGPNVTVSSYEVYAWGVDVTFYNAGSSDENITHVEITGTVLQVQSSQLAKAQDANLLLEDGEISQEVRHDFIQTPAYASSLAATLLNTFKVARRDISMDTRGNPTVHLGDRIIYNDERQGVQVPYAVSRQTFTFTGALTGSMEGTKI